LSPIRNRACSINNTFTRDAQKLERSFIRAWKRYFPVGTSNSSRRRRELKKCVKKLGVLDKAIREQLSVRDPSARQQVHRVQNRPGRPALHRPRTVANARSLQNAVEQQGYVERSGVDTL